MSVGTNTAPVSEFAFTVEEQWAIHQAFVEYVELAANGDTDLPGPTVEVAILEKVEAGDFAFTAYELQRLRYECLHHAESPDRPDRDRDPALAVVEKIDGLCPGDRGR